MKYIVREQVVLSRVPEGPLANYICAFADFLSTQGYSLSSTRVQVRLAASFSRWAKLKDISVRSINSGHINNYLRYRYRLVEPYPGDTAALVHLFDFLRKEDVIPAQKVSKPRLTPVERCAQIYEKYLREDRALAETTIINYVPFILCFLKKQFGKKAVKFSSLCAHDVVRFVQLQAPRLHQK